ncbi:muscle, skeletal receptor tyrosine protein kinase-like [Thunnus albacares]|uniref:muscle, skeletal receptor tyrosine protein kinase-like n=1 Tax=Thunnus albacares TaxID=8236 RepID=UPI001CF6CE44|nr:muscle, skeletal receptor tyrosine protein kinase-like [Thunnus albacares]
MNTSTLINEECPTSWNRRNESHCLIDDLYTSDTGVYWCESGTGGRSNVVNITVTAGPVILESPALPVMEGDDVTLSCKNINTMTFSSNLTTSTSFYKDGFLMATSSTGNMTIHSISQSDEGFYKCNISGVGQSPGSWLTVRAGHSELPQSPLARFLFPVVAVCILLASLIVLYLWNHKGEIDPAVVMYTVTSTRKCNRIGEPLRRNSHLFSSVAVYRPNPGSCVCTSKPVLTYTARTSAADQGNGPGTDQKKLLTTF